MTSKLRLIILGPPGSGKATISSNLVKQFNLAHFSSGDLLRSNIESKTDVGLIAKDYFSKGHLLPDEFMIPVVLNELTKLSMYNQSWLLDGFPRTINQAKALENKDIDRVINLSVGTDEIIKRLKNRWVHAASGRVYNLEYNPPKIPGRDDITGEELTQRADDKASVVLERLKIYEEKIKPVIDFYISKDMIATFCGDSSDYLWPIVKTNVDEIVKAKAEKSKQVKSNVAKYQAEKIDNEQVGHTGQKFALSDYRKGRFDYVGKKEIDENFPIDLSKEQPIIVSDTNIVWSGGGELGFPKVYINLDRDEVHCCGYSGRRFILKKYYDPAKHGKSISYKQYLEEMSKQEGDII